MQNVEIKHKYLIYLDDLRESGVTNMYGASSYLMPTFNLSEKDAQEVVKYWISTFNERHPEDL